MAAPLPKTLAKNLVKNLEGNYSLVKKNNGKPTTKQEIPILRYFSIVFLVSTLDI